MACGYGDPQQNYQKIAKISSVFPVRSCLLYLEWGLKCRIMAESQTIVEQDSQGIIDKFLAVRNLGQTALNLRQESERIFEVLETLGLESFEVPEDMNLYLSPTGHEDPLTTERLGTEWSPDEPEWLPTYPGSGSYRDNMIGSLERRMFPARFIEYDKETKQIWAYNADHTFRVLFRDHMTMDLI